MGMLTLEQQEIIQSSKEKRLDALHLEKKYKCHLCHLILSEDMIEFTPEGVAICKTCKQRVADMCPIDHCHCSHAVIAGLVSCPLCGEPMCPECGSHDVAQISRVTGYLAEVSGWNPAKRAELKDRVRVNLVGTEMMRAKVK